MIRAQDVAPSLGEAIRSKAGHPMYGGLVDLSAPEVGNALDHPGTDEATVRRVSSALLFDVRPYLCDPRPGERVLAPADARHAAVLSRVAEVVAGSDGTLLLSDLAAMRRARATHGARAPLAPGTWGWQALRWSLWSVGACLAIASAVGLDREPGDWRRTLAFGIGAAVLLATTSFPGLVRGRVAVPVVGRRDLRKAARTGWLVAPTRLTVVSVDGDGHSVRAHALDGLRSVAVRVEGDAHVTVTLSCDRGTHVVPWVLRTPEVAALVADWTSPTRAQASHPPRLQ